ncbi:RNA-directed DNA polymerase [Rhodococcus fascians]|nr:RNA-directed DNA polymerase [Rhodococcus fascians]MBY4060462.1 RNA-directed DNA polymerase [Rhodococcus fascians]MBY4069448.1 RNA-directed DNA polymerase [Rhodococcus fascians]MBY4403791.1 RNA-directed DNA polymerase [Rhodococcus fascians]MBY4419102.1 RNA-directed DNA polymerase [Rhodococcus fascians]
MDILAAMERGLLPREVPPLFTTLPLASAVNTLSNPLPTDPTTPVRYSIARAGGTRRATEIPNPFSQFKIAQTCSDNWRALQRITALSPISLSRPVKSKNLGSYRSLSSVQRRKDQSSEIVKRMPGGQVTLKTDVSQFYGSIYTHAVDWAIRGKSRAKANRRARHLGSDLDRYLRNSRDQQTVGISIGPDTSWLISELILGQVDRSMSLHKAIGPWYSEHSYRLGDDMTVFAQSRDQADSILGEYEVALSKFELSLNPSKVEIISGIEAPVKSWVTQIRQMRYRSDSESNLISDLVDIFGTAFELSGLHPGEGVLSYTIKRCDPFPAGPLVWPVYRDFILASITHDPSVMPHAYQVLSFARDHKLPTQDDRVAEVLNNLAAGHARLNHGFEVSWALTILRALKLPLEVETANFVATMDDNCSLLLLGLENESKKIGLTLDNMLSRAQSDGALSSSDWLIAYECRARRWCRPAKWDGIPAWKELDTRGVRFLAPSLNPPSRLRRRRPDFLPSWGNS